MNCLVQRQRFLTVRRFASGDVSARMHTGHAGAQASKIQSKIVAGVERGKALIQSRKRRASFRDIGARGHNSLRLKLGDRKSTRLNSSHSQISYAVFCLKKKK